MTRSPLSSACTLLAMLLAGAGQAAAESFDCIIEPSAISTIVAAEKGVITDVPVARGDMVRKGDVLVRLQSDVEELQLELYRIEAETTVDVASAEKRLELRKTEYERARELENRQVGSRTHAEETEIEMNLTQLALDKARVAQRAAELQLRQSQALLARRTVTSFIDGLVLSVDAQPGEYANEQVALMSLAQIDPLHVDVFLPVEFYDSIKAGDRLAVTQTAPHERRLEATVKTVDHVFDAASGTFGALLEIANPDFSIPSGTRCRLDLEPPSNP